jgi:hypothetical protein
MAGFIGARASVVSSGAERKQTYAITTTTTSLTGLAYTPTKVHVFHNGIRLVDGTDYTATDGETITLTTAAEDGDEVVVISYATFQTSDTVSAANGGTFAGNVAMNGTLEVDDEFTLNKTQTINNDASFYAATIAEANDSQIAFRIGATRAGFTKGMSFGALGSGTNTGIQGYDTSTNTANALTLNPIDGVVLMPNQPTFTAYIQTRTNWTTTGLQRLPFDGTLINQGSHFNTSTNRFTAPTSGRYQFNLSLNVQGNIIVYIYKNGSSYHAGEYRSNPSGIWEHCVIETIITLSTNDYVEAYVNLQGTGNAWNGGGSLWDHFSGHLIN